MFNHILLKSDAIFANFSFDDTTKKVFSATGNEIPGSSSEITLPSIHFGGQYKFLFGKGKNLHFSPIGKVSLYMDKRNVLLAGPVSVDLTMGGEMGIHHIAFIRFGLSNFTMATNSLGEEYMSFVPSLGAGFRLSQLDIDYSYNNVANSGAGLYSHVFSLAYRFNKKDKYSKPNISHDAPPIDIGDPNINDNIPVELD